MMSKSNRTKLFDDWAQSYDAGMKTIDGEFPFDGYRRIYCANGRRSFNNALTGSSQLMFFMSFILKPKLNCFSVSHSVIFHLVGGYLSPMSPFPTKSIRAQAAQHWADQWDKAENYWTADETIAACERVGLHAAYKQISRCGGVFVFSVKDVE